jgi:hypothetical protein
MLNEGEKRDNRIILSAYNKKSKGKAVPPALAAAAKDARERIKFRGKKMMKKDKEQMAAKRAQSMEEGFGYNDLRKAAEQSPQSLERISSTLKSGGAFLASKAPRIAPTITKITKYISDPERISKVALGMRIAKRIGSRLLNPVKSATMANDARKRGGAAMAFKPVKLSDFGRMFTGIRRSTEDAVSKYKAGVQKNKATGFKLGEIIKNTRVTRMRDERQRAAAAATARRLWRLRGRGAPVSIPESYDPFHSETKSVLQFMKKKQALKENK